MKNYGQRDAVRLRDKTSSFVHYADLYLSGIAELSVEHGHIQHKIERYKPYHRTTDTFITFASLSLISRELSTDEHLITCILLTNSLMPALIQ